MASEPVYQMGEHSQLLSALLTNARASLGEIADRVGSYRQKVWRTVQSLQDDLIWGYSAAVDEHRLGWRRYNIMLKVAHVDRQFLENWTRLLDNCDKNPAIRLVDAHAITGVDYNFMLGLTCQNPIELQIFIDALQTEVRPVLDRPPRVIESIHTMRLNGFTNPDQKGLANLIEEMGITGNLAAPPS